MSKKKKTTSLHHVTVSTKATNLHNVTLSTKATSLRATIASKCVAIISTSSTWDKRTARTQAAGIVVPKDKDLDTGGLKGAHLSPIPRHAAHTYCSQSSACSASSKHKGIHSVVLYSPRCSFQSAGITDEREPAPGHHLCGWRHQDALHLGGDVLGRPLRACTPQKSFRCGCVHALGLLA